MIKVKDKWLLNAFFITVFCIVLLVSSLIYDIKVFNNHLEPKTTPKVAVALTNTPTPTLTISPSPIPSPSPSPLPTPIPKPTLTPTPTPVPPQPTIVTSQNLEELFAKYAAVYNVDKEILKKIAKCESGFNPNAVNNDYAGLFQYASSTWISVRGRMSLSSDLALRFNAEEAIRTAAFHINSSGTSAWANCD